MKEWPIWHDFWPRVGGVSIRTKIMGIVAATVLLLGLVMVWYASRDISTTLRGELQQRGIAIANSLAQQGRDLVLTDNQFSLYTMVMNTVDATKDVAYAFVLDGDGDVLVHTFNDGFPSDLLNVNQMILGAPYTVQRLQTEQGVIQDVAVPILDGKAGIIRLGMSETTISTAVTAYVEKILVWVALALVLGLLLAYALASFLSKPLSNLAQAARAVGSGDFRWQAPLWARDEIGALGTAFNEMSKELKHKEDMRAQLLAKVIQAQEEERKRIARELHDEAGQALTSIMMDLSQLRDTLPSDATQAIERVSRSRLVAEQTLAYLRKLIYELRPEVLDELGLVAAIRSYVKNRLQVENTKVNLTFRKLHVRLPAVVETTLFRIIQEAITNIIRHSHGKMIDIEIEAEDTAVIATIKDDGIGFDVEMALADEKSFGLRGMQERVAIVGGELEIESKVGQGTRLIIHLPLNG